MTSDPDIFRAAKLLIDQHGEDAPRDLAKPVISTLVAVGWVATLAALPAGADSIGLDRATPPSWFTACGSFESARAQREITERSVTTNFSTNPEDLIAQGCTHALAILAPPILEIDAIPPATGLDSGIYEELHYYKAFITFKSGPMAGKSGWVIVEIRNAYLEYLHRQYLEDLNKAAKP